MPQKIIKRLAGLMIGGNMDLSLNEFEQIAIAKNVVSNLIAEKTANGFNEKDAELAVLIQEKNLIEMGDKEAIARALDMYIYLQGKLKNETN